MRLSRDTHAVPEPEPTTSSRLDAVANAFRASCDARVAASENGPARDFRPHDTRGGFRDGNQARVGGICDSARFAAAEVPTYHERLRDRRHCGPMSLHQRLGTLP